MENEINFAYVGHEFKINVQIIVNFYMQIVITAWKHCYYFTKPLQTYSKWKIIS